MAVTQAVDPLGNLQHDRILSSAYTVVTEYYAFFKYFRIYDDVKQLIAPKKVTQPESQSHSAAGQENANIINCNR